MKLKPDCPASRALWLKWLAEGAPERGVLEHRFHPARKWRFDIAWPGRMVALEVDGGVFRRKGARPCPLCKHIPQGRHNTAEGARRDREKLTEAAVMGWRVAIVTWDEVADGRAVDIIARLLARGVE